MKKITLLVFLLMTSLGYYAQQSVVQDFETGTDGLGEGFGGAAAEIVADPETGGTRGQVAKLTAVSTGEVWQGININIDSNIELLSDKTMKLDVYSETAISIAPRVQGGVAGAPTSTGVVSHTGSGWETLTVTFNTGSNGDATAEGEYAEFVIYYLWDNGFITPAIDRVMYVDNITGIIAKTLVQDFETGTDGLGEGFGGAAAEIVADPETGGTRGQVAKLTAVSTGEVWQGININIDSNIELLSDKTMKLDVYSETAISIAPRVQGGVAGAPTSTGVVSHTGSGWETLTVTFNTGSNGDATAEGEYAEFVIYYLWDNGFITPAIDRIFYVDNIKGISTEAAVDTSLPTTAPTTPPVRNAGDVISIYSDSYTSRGLTNVSWDGGDASEVTIGDNKLLKMEVGNFLGQNIGSAVDAADMTHFHMDYYVSDDFNQGQVFNSKLSNHEKADGTDGESNALVFDVALTAADVKTWKSVDAVLPAGDKGNILQFLITVSNTVGVAYLDNIYLYKEATTGVRDNELLNVSMYPNPAADRLNISASNTIKNASIFNILGKKVMSLEINKNSESIDVSSLASGIYLIKYSIDNAIGTAKFIKH
ncbi:MAG: T9SS type A sorting domain-containing protein [Polaribacter sp.]